jgi:hypothetical protein
MTNTLSFVTSSRRPSLKMSRRERSSSVTVKAALLVAMAAIGPCSTDAFSHPPAHLTFARTFESTSELQMASSGETSEETHFLQSATKFVATAALSAALFFGAGSAVAEDELAAKYGGKGFDSSLVDQQCLVDKCSLQAKACLADDPSCRKGLTCTAKCMGDNACITGCMARYGDSNLDNLLKCTIEDNNCIKVAILDGGSDKFGEEPLPPAPTVPSFQLASMEGAWYKVAGFNPNYDCYACQRNTFSSPEGGNMLGLGKDRLQVDVEFSMPRMLPDGSPPPPENKRETIKSREGDGFLVGSKSIGFNDYATHETMIFDGAKDTKSALTNLVLGKGSDEKSFSRTAHSEGEMFGLKFWENWYIIGENDADQPDFKFVYYNGKTRQNTYEGAFVYSRTKDLGPEAMKKVYKIAADAGMNPDQFCKIQNGCFQDEQTFVTQPETGLGAPSNPFRGILASTKVSQLLGVEPVAAENLRPAKFTPAYPKDDTGRAWWYNVYDYLEDPHRHFQVMDDSRVIMDWPETVKNQQTK